MAFTQILVRRSCPTSAFEQLEEVVANHVGTAVYGARYPEEAAVDAATQYGRLGTHVALKVEIDTEDLPGHGWHVTPSGLCLPPDSEPILPEYRQLPLVGLTGYQRNAHFAVLGKKICESLAADPIWEDGGIGWESNMDPLQRLGVLVAMAEGAWYATYSSQEQ